MFNKYLNLFKSLFILTIKIWLSIIGLFLILEMNRGGLSDLIFFNPIINLFLLLFVTSPIAFLLGLLLFFVKRVMINFPASFQFIFILAIAFLSLFVIGFYMVDHYREMFYSILIAVPAVLIFFIREISNPNQFSRSDHFQNPYSM